MGAGLFIGKGGEHVKATCLSLLGVFKVRRGALRIRRGSDSAEAIREACGGNLFIGVIPPAQGNGPHKIQIIGDQRAAGLTRRSLRTVLAPMCWKWFCGGIEHSKEKAKAMVRQRLKAADSDGVK